MCGFRAWAQAPTGTLPLGDTREMLAPFRGQRASVVLWNVQTDHRVLSVHSGAYERMRLEARARVRETGVVLDHALSDIAPVAPRTAHGSHQDIVLASAPAAEVAAATAPLTEAGIRVEAMLTPAAALQSLARLRAAGLPSGTAGAGIEAWIALHEASTCIAALRGGQLIGAHDVAWGFLDELSDFQSQRDRYDVAVRLADEVAAFVAARHFGAPLTQVVVCGAMPELRSMSVQMMDRLDVEVEPLDSLFGIDERHLPVSEDVFHDAASGLRLAWAAAGNLHPALDLYRARKRRVTKLYLSRAAVFAGAAAGLSVGWTIAHALPAVTPPPRAVATAAEPRSPAPIVAARREQPAAPAERTTAPPLLARRTIAAPAGMLIATMIPTPLAATMEQPEESASAPAPAERRPWEAVPPLTAAVRMLPASVPVRPAVAPQVPPSASPDRPAARRLEPPRPAPAAQKTMSQEPVMPFEATLETILFGRDRSLAIVNGRIVQVGDVVDGAHIIEITPGAVMLRDSLGRLRRLSLGTR